MGILLSARHGSLTNDFDLRHSDVSDLGSRNFDSHARAEADIVLIEY
jgi:hypothetical protein